MGLLIAGAFITELIADVPRAATLPARLRLPVRGLLYPPGAAAIGDGAASADFGRGGAGGFVVGATMRAAASHVPRDRLHRLPDVKVRLRRETPPVATRDFREVRNEVGVKEEVLANLFLLLHDPQIAIDGHAVSSMILGMRKISTTVYLTHEQNRRLRALSDATRIPAAEFIREAVERALASFEIAAQNNVPQSWTIPPAGPVAEIFAIAPAAVNEDTPS